jgi:hypothetical protein
MGELDDDIYTLLGRSSSQYAESTAGRLERGAARLVVTAPPDLFSSRFP